MYRRIDDRDVPAIVALMNRAYRSEGPRTWASEAPFIAGSRTTANLLRAEIAESPAASLLAWHDEPDGSVFGCVWLNPLGEGVWYLGSLAVMPERQGGGHGRVMLAAAEDWARARGAVRIRMSVVHVRDTLIAWYVRRGYAPTGETAAFPYGDERFGSPLRDDLHFVVMEKVL